MTGSASRAPRMGVQLGAYGTGPFGRRPEEDLPGVLDIVAGAGFTGVEFHPNVGYAGGASVRVALAGAGLVAAALHVFDDEVETPAAQDRILELATEAGCPRVILTAHTLLRATSGPVRAASFRGAAELLDRLVTAATPALTVSYHPHDVDFRPLPDASGTGLALLLREAPPELTVALDLYWAHVGGADPAAALAELGGRVDYLHVRDGDPRRTSPLGAGEVPLVPALRWGGSRPDPPSWLVYEDATPRLPPTASCRAARSYLAGHGFA